MKFLIVNNFRGKKSRKIDFDDFVRVIKNVNEYLS